MDRSNIRESKSFEENEVNMNTMKTIHSLDEIYKTYVPRTVAKNDKPEPATSLLKTPNTETRIKSNFISPVARNLAPLVYATPYQAYGICAPRVQFSYIPYFPDHRNNQELNNAEVSAMRIASGQINRKGCASFDSTGSPTCILSPNNVTFAEPQRYNGSFCSQHGYYGDPAYSGYDFLGYPDRYQPQYSSDQGLPSCYSQQASSTVDGCSGSRDSAKRCSVTDSCFDSENKSISSNKSVSFCGNKKCSDQLINDDCTATSSEGCSPTRHLSLVTCPCQKSQMLHDSYPCNFRGIAHHLDNRTDCSSRRTESCDSLKRKCRRVRIAGDNCSRSSSQESNRSTCSRNSRCSGSKTSLSTRGFVMPDPEARMICAEGENNCNGPAATSCSHEKLACPPMICWDGCNVGSFYNTMDNCCISSAYLNGCYLNDALQDSTVYNRDYPPIMCACNHLYQHYGGCCWQDLPLGGGCGPCGCSGSCGGYGALSNLPDCCPFPVDANRYVPPSATMDTCSRPFCDHYADEPHKSHPRVCACPSCPTSLDEGCCSRTDCLPPPPPSCRN